MLHEPNIESGPLDNQGPVEMDPVMVGGVVYRRFACVWLAEDVIDDQTLAERADELGADKVGEEHTKRFLDHQGDLAGQEEESIFVFAGHHNDLIKGNLAVVHRDGSRGEWIQAWHRGNWDHRFYLVVPQEDE